MTTLRHLLLSVLLAVTPLLSAFAYDDGLKRSTPEAEGISSQAIEKFFADLDESGLEVHSIMILRHDKVIAEHWWAPYSPDLTHAMYSATKTFTSMAIGFAVQEGLINIEDRVMDFFPELLPEKISPQLEALKVKHLLSMSVGHKSMSYAGSGLPQVKSFLAAEFEYEPGTHFAYNITASHMLSNILRRVTGITIYEYLTPRLLEPLGIRDIVWEMDNDGTNMGNGGMHLRTSDMAKMGIFLNNKGKWNGKQLLNSEWIEAATTPKIYQVDPNGPIEDAKDDGAQGYGYQIWMGRRGSYRAIGGMGQTIMVFPGKDFVVVSTCALRDEAKFNEIIYSMLPALTDKKLKERKGFDINQAIAKYNLPMPFEPSAEPVLKSCAKRYSMLQNPYGIENIYFRFDAKGDCYMTFVAGAAVSNIPFALDGWKVGATDRRMIFARPAYPNLSGVTPYYTNGSCSWTKDGKLNARYISMFNPGIQEDFQISFNGDELVIEVLPAASAQPGAPGRTQAPVILKGVIE
ncbi:MAG: beta-lactamase family protein [Bacteroidales bacterium]|nr:beta-lactamase family protein [Bacteroidales bacterium]